MYIVIESSIWLNKMVVSKICRFWMKFDWSNQTLLVTYKANLLILIFQQTRLTTFNEKNIIHKNITDDDDRSGDPALVLLMMLLLTWPVFMLWTMLWPEWVHWYRPHYTGETWVTGLCSGSTGPLSQHLSTGEVVTRDSISSIIRTLILISAPPA